MLRLSTILLSALLLFGCSGGASSEAAPEKLRFSAIPDFQKTALAKNCEELADYLTKKLGVEVTYLPTNDYTATVNALVSNKVDFVWLGGKTTCDAIDEGNGHVRVIATRDIDLRFKSYFIANHELIESGRLGPIHELEDLRPKASELTFTFGDRNSTSGHLMPRYFLTEAGIDPDKDFKSCGYQLSGGHSATLAAVAKGATDLGALNYTVWDRAGEDLQRQAPILWTTPEYVDYAWCAHDRIGEEMLEKLTRALTSMDRSNEEDRKILAAWSTKEKFVRAEASEWDKIRKVRDSLPRGFLR